jgi:hypothetical protein
VSANPISRLRLFGVLRNPTGRESRCHLPVELTQPRSKRGTYRRWRGSASVVGHAVTVRRRNLSYREINDSWTLRDGLFTAILYDLVAFPLRVVKQRKNRRIRMEAEQAQLLKREMRRSRRGASHAQ